MMQPPPLLEPLARRAYERARLRRALVGSLPVAIVVALATAFTSRLAGTAIAGAVLLAAGMVGLWWGHGLQRALLPGLFAGVLPLVTALCATRFGHLCFDNACTSVCLAGHGLGGLGAGALVAGWIARKHAPLPMAGFAAAFGLLTGALAGTCVGARGIALLAASFITAFALRLLLAKRHPEENPQ